MSNVNVWVTSPDTHSERRYDLNLTVEQLKAKLVSITGISVGDQVITLLDSEKDPRVLASLTDDSKPLGFYGVRDWNVLKVDNKNPGSGFIGQLTDISQVQKFELTDEAYAERQDTILAYKQKHKIGRFAPRTEQQEVSQPEPKEDIALGSRCEVESTEPGLHKRGTVRYYGATKFGPGLWVGVEYDEPLGKNDGSVQGERYFSCKPNYGVFVRAGKVKTGDYPVVELDSDIEEM